jgi:hypothetical protein
MMIRTESDQVINRIDVRDQRRIGKFTDRHFMGNLYMMRVITNVTFERLLAISEDSYRIFTNGASRRLPVFAFGKQFAFSARAHNDSAYLGRLSSAGMLFAIFA